MFKFLIGCVVGGVFMSALWMIYIAYFIDDASSMGRRLRTWVRLKAHR
jgi:hypothetical protein